MGASVGGELEIGFIVDFALNLGNNLVMWSRHNKRGIFLKGHYQC